MSLQTLNENLNIIQNLVIPFLEDDLDNIQKLDDEPNDVGGLTAAELKAEFDKAGNTIKEYLNETLIPQLSDTVAEAEVRAAAERERVANENIRIGNENDRIENEDARVENETARVNAEKARADAESARKTAESQRATAENARESQEATRKSNETARESAENTRTTQEATRQNRESTRQSNEQTRQSQEQSRKTSEAQRASAESQRQAAERARAEAEANRQNSFAQELNQAQEAKRLAERAAGEAESAAEGIGAYGKEVEAILFASGWSGSGPYTQTVSISGANEDSFGNVGLPESATKAQRDEARGSNLFVSDVGAGTITVTADGSKPTIDIPILVQFGQVISGSVGDVPSGGISITLDTTLSKSGYAADAKAVGDALAKFKGVPTVTTAAIGQTIRVSAVDDAGKPTEWEAVEFPAGGGAEPKRLYYGTAENVTAFTDSVDFENYRNFVVVVGGTKGETAISIQKGDLSIGEMVVNVGYYTKFLDATTTSYPDGCVIHNLTEIGEKEGYPVFRIEYAQHNINIKPEMDVWQGPASTSWAAKTGMIVARKDKDIPKNSVALKFSAEVSYLEVTIYGY